MRRPDPSAGSQRPPAGAPAVARPPLSPGRGPWDLAFDVGSLAIVVALVMLAWATFRDYGITWDETWHMTYGQYILDWYASGFADRSALSYRGDYLYGGAFDALGAVFVRLSPMAWYDTLHLFGAMVGVLGVAGTWRLGRVLGGPAAGFFAAALLATASVYYGHMFNNPKDIPFAAGYVWAMSELVLVLRALPSVRRGQWVRMGLAAGAAMSVRVGGMLVLCYLLAALGAFVARAAWRGHSRRLAARLGWRLFRGFMGALGVAWAVMLVAWPWALLDPVRRPFFALGRMTRFNLHLRTMPFGDREIQTIDVPWDYLPRYFLFKLPEHMLLLALVAAAVGAVWAWRARTKIQHDADVLVVGTVALAIIFPPLWAIVLRSSLYDGLRHFLFLVPMLAAIGGWVVAAGIGWMSRSQGLPGWTLGGVVLAGCAAQIPVMRELHPHEYVYFNRIAGRLPGVYGRYDTDYYGNGYREAFEALKRELWRTDPEGFLTARHRVSGCIPAFVARRYMGSVLFWREQEDKHRAEFFVAYQRNKCHDRYRTRPVFVEVARQGAPIILVRDLRPAPRSASGGARAPGSGGARAKGRGR